MTKTQTATYTYINEQKEIFIIEREYGKWMWHFAWPGIEFFVSSWHDTRRECKQEIEKRYGKIVALSTYKRGKK